MSGLPLGRRRFLAVLAAGGTLAAAGGAAVFAANVRDSAAYRKAADAIWRQSSDAVTPDAVTPLTSARRELVRYATLAANSHNT